MVIFRGFITQTHFRDERALCPSIPARIHGFAGRMASQLLMSCRASWFDNRKIWEITGPDRITTVGSFRSN